MLGGSEFHSVGATTLKALLRRFAFWYGVGGWTGGPSWRSAGPVKGGKHGGGPLSTGVQQHEEIYRSVPPDPLTVEGQTFRPVPVFFLNLSVFLPYLKLKKNVGIH